MPEQNEWIDGDDYTWPKQAEVDCRTGPQKQADEIAMLAGAVNRLTDQVEYLTRRVETLETLCQAPHL